MLQSLTSHCTRCDSISFSGTQTRHAVLCCRLLNAYGFDFTRLRMAQGIIPQPRLEGLERAHSQISNLLQAASMSAKHFSRCGCPGPSRPLQR